MKLASGVRLGPYEILEPVGAGGMGEVYRARDTRLGRTVAIKILPDEFAQDARLRARFQSEAKNISALTHPHICTLHDIGSDNGVDYLVMEYCDGKTLAKRIAEGPLPIELVLQYGIEIADALEKAHRQGIIHRDLKPSNIMLTKSGVKLLDFGLAKQHVISTPEEPTVQRVTEEGHILGTIQYMAPELFHGNEADARSDLFAFGLVLYEMVTGKPAFTGASKASLIAAILEHEPEPLEPASPPALDRLIRACLAKDPAERIQSTHDAKLQLQWIRESNQEVAAPRARRRFVMTSVAAVLVSAVVVGIVTWLIARPRLAPQPLRRFTISLPSNAPVHEALAISRDGRRIVYRSSDTGPLYLRNMDSAEVKPLVGTEGTEPGGPFFSPDGEWIGFHVAGEMKKIAVAGGAPVVVCKTAPIRGAAWLADDTIVFSSQNAPLRRVAASGGTPTSLTPAPNFEYWPTPLPDGHHLLYTIGPNTGDYTQAKIAVLSLRDGRSRILLEGGTFARYARDHLIYSRSGTLFAVRFDPDKLTVKGSATPIAVEVAGLFPMGKALFDVSEDGTLVYVPQAPFQLAELVWVDRKGVVTPVTTVRREYGSPRISPDGRQLAVEVSNELWMFDMKRETWTRFTSGGINGGPVWSHDGQQLLFASNRSGPYNIYVQPSDGSQAPRQLTHEKMWIFPLAISHDTLVAWGQQVRGPSTDYWLVNLAHPENIKPFLTKGEYQYGVDVSPDGRWVAFSSDETGRPEIYLSTFPELGRKWPVSTDGGTKPRFRNDGRELFFRNTAKLMAVDIALGSEPAIGKPRMLFEGDFAPEYDVTPDGQRFVFVRGEKETPRTQINVVTGLFDNLGR